jgi:hypothetical protein
MRLGLLCTLICTLTLASTGAQDHPPIGKLIDVGGYRVHLFCIGSGSPAVVIVGSGYSFDWALVQPDVSKFTQVCAYDHSGIAWSDPGPTDSCSLRVSEVHSALKKCKDFRSIRARWTLTWRTGCQIVRGQIPRRSCRDGNC